MYYNLNFALRKLHLNTKIKQSIYKCMILYAYANC